MAQKMTDDEALAFLAEGRPTGKLATTRRSGAPHVAPIWFLVDGRDIVFTTGEDTVKGRSLSRDGRAALCVDVQDPPFDFVTVEGTVTISRDQDELLTWATRLAARYMGEDVAESYGRRNAVPEELLVRLHPERILGLRAIAD